MPACSFRRLELGSPRLELLKAHIDMGSSRQRRQFLNPPMLSEFAQRAVDGLTPRLRAGPVLEGYNASNPAGM